MSLASRTTMRQRSLRVLVSPPPITFAERRSVLQVLEQHGPIEFFQLAQGYQSNFVSVAQSIHTANKLVSNSPLTYAMSTPRTDINPAIADLEESTKFDELKISHAESQDDGGEQKEFKLHIYPDPDYNHEFSMTNDPLYDTWPRGYDKNRTFTTSTLEQTLPHNVARKGLSHWLTDFPPMALVTKKEGLKKERRLQLKAWVPSTMKQHADDADERSSTTLNWARHGFTLQYNSMMHFPKTAARNLATDQIRAFLALVKPATTHEIRKLKGGPRNQACVGRQNLWYRIKRNRIPKAQAAGIPSARAGLSRGSPKKKLGSRVHRVQPQGTADDDVTTNPLGLDWIPPDVLLFEDRHCSRPASCQAHGQGGDQGQGTADSGPVNG
ncbi:hypothetical protein S40285_10507 [Stachybotrys chlorohalonatus IBT 40285]|uniref:Uncharacterized protein n=1 Tax=Stachybotrys chlorohalonatus (strain IBT 40285) TaxID=1283841 RepID=A0A084QPU3_STAC4|nr:hypothetical protein S40285_10507 [Stachybotrys chlorohalonata IBT 40285]